MKTVNPAEAAATLFKKHFGYTPPHVVKAPGRLELLDSLADDNQGIVLSVAVDKYVCIASAPRTDGRIELISSAFPGRELFWMSEPRRNPAAPWADCVKGVLAQLRKRGANFSGFNAAIHGSIPAGVDMGGAAAQAVAAALTVRRLYPFSLTETGATLPPKRNEKGELPPLSLAERMHFAKVCGVAESGFAVTRGGIVDPVSSLFGKAWNVLNIDCRFLTVETEPIVGETIIVCETGRETSNAERGTRSAEQNGQSLSRAPELSAADRLMEEIRQNSESAAQKLQAKSLRSVEMKYLQLGKSRLTPREYECAYHVVGEIQRAVFAERALRDDDHRQFGQYLFQSHESARDFLKDSCEELDLLVELARKHPGCLGARPIGGGSGGATLNLVAYHQAEKFMETIARQYEARTGRKMKPFVCQIVDGAA